MAARNNKLKQFICFLPGARLCGDGSQFDNHFYEIRLQENIMKQDNQKLLQGIMNDSNKLVQKGKHSIVSYIVICGHQY